MITSLLFPDYSAKSPFLLKPDHILKYSIEVCSCIKDRLQILQTITETPDFCRKVYFYQFVSIYPQSPRYPLYQKTPKVGGFSTHCDEPRQALKT